MIKINTKLKEFLAITCVLLAVGCQPQPVAANDDISVLFGGWSYHTDRQFDVTYNDGVTFKEKRAFNEDHNMIGIEYNDFVLATFNNSYYHQSVLIGYNYQLTGFSFADNVTHEITVLTGLVYGYQDQELSHVVGNMSLYVLPMIRTKYKLANKIYFGVDTGILLSDNALVTTNFNLTFEF